MPMAVIPVRTGSCPGMSAARPAYRRTRRDISRYKPIRGDRQKQEVEPGVHRLRCHFGGPGGCGRFGRASTARTSICRITSA